MSEKHCITRSTHCIAKELSVGLARQSIACFYAESDGLRSGESE
jgi:hypothetical protein